MAREPSIYRSEAGKKEIKSGYESFLRQWPVARKCRHVETGFGSTFVIESGMPTNPPVLLLHGSMSNSLTWMGDVEELTTSHRVIAVDLIGEAGFSDPNRPAYESGAYARWLNELIDGLGLEKVSIVGLSLGGWMALEFATNHPGRVSHLSLLCPGGVVRENASFLWKAIFYMCLGDWGKNQITKLVNGGELPDSQGLTDAFEFMSLVGKHFRPRTAKLPLFSDEALGRLTMPVQAICGEKDALIPPQQTIDRLAKLVPNADTHLLPDVGHAVTGQASKISRFLRNRVGVN